MNYQKLVQKIGVDKVAHFAVSSFLALALSCFLSIWASAPLTMAIGVAKELYDKKKTGLFDKKDLIADALGTAAGAVVWLLTLLK